MIVFFGFPMCGEIANPLEGCCYEWIQTLDQKIAVAVCFSKRKLPFLRGVHFVFKEMVHCTSTLKFHGAQVRYISHEYKTFLARQCR